MKKVIFWLCASTWMMIACTKESNSNYPGDTLLDLDNAEFTIESQKQTDLFDASVFALEEEKRALLHTRSTNPVFLNVAPVAGCPGKTSYLFAVKDYYLEPPVAVKLFSPSGNTYYVNMFRSGNYQYRFIKLLTHGRWYWRYVYTLNKQPCEPNKASYWKENTPTRFDGTTVQVSWPFQGRSCWVKTCGHGCNFHLSTYNEYYAQDWACTQGTKSKPFLSPLDGMIADIGWAPKSYGNYVEIDQLHNGVIIRLRIAHLESVGVVKDQRVKAGSTVIGTLGSTGNSSGAHAHCSVFVSNDGEQWENVAFEFAEECEEWKQVIKKAG